MSEPESNTPLPSRTTPTWEVELLISGVAVFAMLQLPGQLDHALFWLEPRLGEDWRLIATMSYLYAKSAAVILAVTFVLHLLLRAHWIALVGMHSVHPDGIRWDRLNMGPVQQEVERSRGEHLPQAIERADNRATTLFAVGVMLASLTLWVALTAIVVYALGSLIAWLSGNAIPLHRAMMMIGALVMLPYALLATLDRHFATRWREGSRARGLLHRALTAYAKVGFSRGNNPIMALLASHGGDRKTVLLTSGLMILALLGVAILLPTLQEPDRLGDYALFPHGDGMPAVDSSHYDDQRDPDRAEAAPYVQSMVATGPYLQLVVPYVPRRVEAPMRQCAVDGPATDEARAAALLACLGRLHAVSLDGRPLADLRYEASNDPRTDRPALLAMIDVRDLAPGRHELRIARPPYSDRRARKNRPDPGHDRIVFWR